MTRKPALEKLVLGAAVIVLCWAAPASAQPAAGDDSPAKPAAPPAGDAEAATPQPDATTGGNATAKPKPAGPAAKPVPAGVEPAPAAPPSEEDIARAREAFTKGAELFEAEDFKGAIKHFKESYRLSRNPLLLYNIGFTLDQMGDKRLALFYFEKFITDAPADAGQRKEVERMVKLLRRELASSEKARAAAEPEDAEPAKPAVTEFMHKVVEEAPPGKPLDITAFIPDGADWQVKLFYRGSGDAKFDNVAMRPRYNELVGRIPARETASDTIQYYIEARDKQGKVVATSGKSTSPHLVLVDPEAKPNYYPDLTDERDWEGAGGLATAPTAGPGGPAGGLMDVGSNQFNYAKWGATGAALGSLTLSISFYLVAANAASSLEGEAEVSRTETCPMGPPCRAFSDVQKDLQDKGERYSTLSNVFLATGFVTAGVAGYFWYKEIKERRSGDSSADADASTGITAAPVVGDDFVGGAAWVRF